MSFDVDLGHFSARGPREANEDFAAALAPAPGDDTTGLIAAIADGVSSGGHGIEAAQTSVMSLVDDYAAAPPTWDTTAVLDRLIGAQNAWLADHNRRRSGPGGGGGAGMTTLTALVLRGHGYTLAHVGDTRAWLLRGTQCTQLTQDHCFDHPDQTSRLTRAVGLDDRVRVDYEQGELRVGDAFALTSDGVHGRLPPARIAALLREGGAQAASELLVRAALEAGSRDNATALVMRVRGLAGGGFEDERRRAHLPLPPRLKIGDALDGYTITALVSDNGVHRIYQARETSTRELVAIKTLHEARASDSAEREMLAHEAWLGARVTEPRGTSRDDRREGGFVRLREPHEASTFYTVHDWHGGRTLEQMLAEGRVFAVGEVLDGALAVARALGRLHRLGVVHRDIKPANLHLGDDGRWRVLDLGVAVSGREPKVLRTLHAGTPSYMNPEQWSSQENVAADVGSDLYALGVTLYRWLTGKLPYGEGEPYQRARFRRDPKPPSRLSARVPIWLDQVVLKAVALDRTQRFETAEEFVLALERGAARPLAPLGATALATRDPRALWMIALAVSLLFNLLLVVWLLFLPR